MIKTPFRIGRSYGVQPRERRNLMKWSLRSFFKMKALSFCLMCLGGVKMVDSLVKTSAPTIVSSGSDGTETREVAMNERVRFVSPFA